MEGVMWPTDGPENWPASVSPEVFIETVRGMLERAGTLPNDSPSASTGSPGGALPPQPHTA
jgi:hypothetical protein